MQFIELGPFKGQIIHQAFLAKYKRYDRVLNIGGIQRVPIPSEINATDPSTLAFQPSLFLKDFHQTLPKNINRIGSI